MFALIFNTSVLAAIAVIGIAALTRGESM